ncbi:unnamed protein product [Bursaphelenchus okinawaensis]|uniref:Uncharacterized protein n=1 Tax=Bursaphelenchus okinawaensis TaxID=465554 RepID=A0A811LIW4_9BILA|nr:unnamed protein product [Bursaphelenchus okinawaensis]CAG9123410.1 unnamed protein product [Bursaphelenchus okinawaensis]
MSAYNMYAPESIEAEWTMKHEAPTKEQIMALLGVGADFFGDKDSAQPDSDLDEVEDPVSMDSKLYEDEDQEDIDDELYESQMESDFFEDENPESLDSGFTEDQDESDCYRVRRPSIMDSDFYRDQDPDDMDSDFFEVENPVEPDSEDDEDDDDDQEEPEIEPVRLPWDEYESSRVKHAAKSLASQLRRMCEEMKEREEREEEEKKEKERRDKRKQDRLRRIQQNKVSKAPRPMKRSASTMEAQSTVKPRDSEGNTVTSESLALDSILMLPPAVPAQRPTVGDFRRMLDEVREEFRMVAEELEKEKMGKQAFHRKKWIHHHEMCMHRVNAIQIRMRKANIN